jgi:hypothetical protein
MLSILWVIIAATVTAMSFSAASISGSFAFIEGQGDTAWSHSSAEYAAARAAVLDGKMVSTNVRSMPGISLYLFTGTKQQQEPVVARLAPIMKGFYAMKRGEAQTSILVTGAVWTLGLPLVVLALGAGVGWAISGFRTAKP